MEGCVPIVLFPPALRVGLLGEWEWDRFGVSLVGEGGVLSMMKQVDISTLMITILEYKPSYEKGKGHLILCSFLTCFLRI